MESRKALVVPVDQGQCSETLVQEMKMQKRHFSRKTRIYFLAFGLTGVTALILVMFQ